MVTGAVVLAANATRLTSALTVSALALLTATHGIAAMTVAGDPAATVSGTRSASPVCIRLNAVCPTAPTGYVVTTDVADPVANVIVVTVAMKVSVFSRHVTARNAVLTVAKAPVVNAMNL